MGGDIKPVQTGPGAHPASCKMGTGSFPGVKYGRGVLLTTHLLLVPWSWKSRAIPLHTLWAITEPITGTLYPFIMSFMFVTRRYEFRCRENPPDDCLLATGTRGDSVFIDILSSSFVPCISVNEAPGSLTLSTGSQCCYMVLLLTVSSVRRVA